MPPTSPPTSESPGAAAGRGPRRLVREARHRQLVAAAMPIVAAQGLSDFSLDEIAARADVSRNLLYHYFPRGRPDIVLAVAEEAGRRLTDEWVTDEAIPPAERLAANNGRMIEHAMRPTDAWTIYQLARGASDPELRETVERFVDVVIAAVSLNRLGTPDPPPLARVALRGYLAFFGAVLDEARATGMRPERVLSVLNETLVAAVGASR